MDLLQKYWDQIVGAILILVGIVWIVKKSIPVGFEGRKPLFHLNGNAALFLVAIVMVLSKNSFAGLSGRSCRLPVLHGGRRDENDGGGLSGAIAAPLVTVFVKKMDMKHIRMLLIMGFLSSLFGLGGCGKDTAHEVAPASQVEVTAQLNHLLMPIDRGERYEDPLDKALRQKGLGGTDGGGTMQHRSGEIEYIDVEIILNDKENGIPDQTDKK